MRKSLYVISFSALVFASIVGGFTGKGKQAKDHLSQTAPRGMVLVEADSFLPFYISATEESNANWQVYLQWITETYGPDHYLLFDAIPQDSFSSLWKSYNDPVISHYFEHPSYGHYPVTGVTWLQVNAYLRWKTDRLNQYILQKAEIGRVDLSREKYMDHFNTEAYLSDQVNLEYSEKQKKLLPYYGSYRKDNHEIVTNGILFPHYRLPTEKEWELAADYISDPKNESQLKESFSRYEPLTLWTEYFHIPPGVALTESVPVSAASNFSSGVSEWLLDNETYRWKPYSSNYDILMENGYVSFQASNPYNQYSDVTRKNYNGELPFVFVQVSSINQPVYVGKPPLSKYGWQDTTVSSIIFRHDSLKSPEEKAIFNTSFYYGYFNSRANLVRILELADRFPGNTTQIFENVRVEFRYIVTANLTPLRKYKTGNFQSPGKKTSFMAQGSSSSLLGFRCVLPFTGVPVTKGNKIR